MQIETNTRPASFPTLDPAECYGLLSSTTVGRVAFGGADGLVLLPVNFQVYDGDILLRTSSNGALSELASHSGEVLFEVDYHASSARQGWSVLLRGTSARVTDPAVLESAELARLMPWAPGSHSLALVIHPLTITGRRVHLS